MEYKEFPMMVFHIVNGEKGVNSAEELAIAIKQGWQKTPIVLSEKEQIIDKIEYHEKELKRLKVVLAGFLPDIEPEKKKEIDIKADVKKEEKNVALKNENKEEPVVVETEPLKEAVAGVSKRVRNIK